MKTIEIIAQDVFDKIRSRFTNLQMGDEDGGVTMDPRKSRFFDFDFTIENNNLGRVSISINELGTLKLFYGKSLLENSDIISRDYWYDFLREMRMFAKRRLLRFDTRDITKSNLDKDDFQYLANKGSKEETMNMSESVKFTGGKKISYGVLEQTKIIVKHKKSIEDESFGARSRVHNIESIFIENEIGERYKMPVLWMPGAKAMQMHCAHHGKPYDQLGETINKMCEQVAQLSAFKRHMSRHDTMNKEANEIAERANMKLEALKQQAHKLGTRQGYREWAESFEPMSTMQGMAEMDDATMEDYKSKFTVSSFKEDLAQYFPLLHSIMQETSEIDLEEYVNEGNAEYCDSCDRPVEKCVCDDESTKKEGFEAFESWANAVVEGKLGMDQLGELHSLLDTDAFKVVGTDATGIIQALEGIGIEDDALTDALEELARLNPQADPKATIGAWLQKDDPEAAKELGLVPEQPVAQAPAAGEQPPAEQPAEQPPVEEPVTESPEDRTSYKVARYLFDKGLRYKPENEKDIIKMIGGAMMKMGMSHKEVRYLMSYDEDFLPDTLGELRHMEQAVDEVGEGVDMDKIPAYIRKQKQQSQDAAQKSIDQKNKQSGAKVWSSPRVPKEDEEGYEKEIGKEKEKPSIKELAQWIGGHYNQHYKEEGFNSGFRKGASELGLMAEKQFGPGYGELVEKMVSDMDDSALDKITRRADKRRAEEADEMQSGDLSPIHGESQDFARIMKLAGLAK